MAGDGDTEVRRGARNTRQSVSFLFRLQHSLFMLPASAALRTWALPARVVATPRVLPRLQVVTDHSRVARRLGARLLGGQIAPLLLDAAVLGGGVPALTRPARGLTGGGRDAWLPGVAAAVVHAAGGRPPAPANNCTTDKPWRTAVACSGCTTSASLSTSAATLAFRRSGWWTLGMQILTGRARAARESSPGVRTGAERVARGRGTGAFVHVCALHAVACESRGTSTAFEEEAGLGLSHRRVGAAEILRERRTKREPRL